MALIKTKPKPQTAAKPPAKKPPAKKQIQKASKPAGPAAWKVMGTKWLDKAMQTGPAKRLARISEALAVLDALDRIRKAADVADNDITLTLQAIALQDQPGGGWLEINVACEAIGEPLVFPCWAGSPMSTHLSHAAVSVERHLSMDERLDPKPKTKG